MLKKDMFFTVTGNKKGNDMSVQVSLLKCVLPGDRFVRVKQIVGPIKHVFTLDLSLVEVAEVSDDFVRTFIPDFERNVFVSSSFKKEW